MTSNDALLRPNLVAPSHWHIRLPDYPRSRLKCSVNPDGYYRHTPLAMVFEADRSWHRVTLHLPSRAAYLPHGVTLSLSVAGCDCDPPTEPEDAQHGFPIVWNTDSLHEVVSLELVHEGRRRRLRPLGHAHQLSNATPAWRCDQRLSLAPHFPTRFEFLCHSGIDTFEQVDEREHHGVHRERGLHDSRGGVRSLLTHQVVHGGHTTRRRQNQLPSTCELDGWRSGDAGCQSNELIWNYPSR